jgi:hypothetical protein
MSASTRANDWECVGVATVGGAAMIGGSLTMFQFRSKAADFLGEYLFTSGGFGVGGSLNSAVAPSPSDLYNGGRNINYWSKLTSKAFSADDLSNALGEMSTAGVSAAYGYSLVYISAGLFDPYFKHQYIGGWGIGVGASVTAMAGVWIRLSSKNYY